MMMPERLIFKSYHFLVNTFGSMSTSVNSEKLSAYEILPKFAGKSETAHLRRIGYNVYRDAEMGRCCLIV
ncbi:hypothetical protein OESDEN_15346 [Oesophagostomum dentatum]|uniref:Uncharacterized protein n=1 Tax=Oesophagostomum dentatum TaxID=61180 RepID=A0A0B1SJ35_OESDE|nr:hypothetical protein OESDEN_15346 [Oesophagostomum dentatum]